VVGGKNKTVKSSCLSCRWPYTSKIKKQRALLIYFSSLTYRIWKSFGFGGSWVCVCGGEGKAGGVAAGGCFLELLRFVGGVLPTPTQGAHNKNQPTRVPTPPFFLPTTNTTAARNPPQQLFTPFWSCINTSFLHPTQPNKASSFFFFKPLFFLTPYKHSCLFL
jgi:hypothetical protein